MILTTRCCRRHEAYLRDKNPDDGGNERQVLLYDGRQFLACGLTKINRAFFAVNLLWRLGVKRFTIFYCQWPQSPQLVLVGCLWDIYFLEFRV